MNVLIHIVYEFVRCPIFRHLNFTTNFSGASKWEWIFGYLHESFHGRWSNDKETKKARYAPHADIACTHKRVTCIIGEKHCMPAVWGIFRFYSPSETRGIPTTHACTVRRTHAHGTVAIFANRRFASDDRFATLHIPWQMSRNNIDATTCIKYWTTGLKIRLLAKILASYRWPEIYDRDRSDLEDRDEAC